MDRAHRTQFLARFGERILRTRWLVRAPIGLYRARLGVLFGSRLCMIEHVGRNTGKLRYVVVEVVDRPTRSSVIVASGFGTRAQWYRNIVADPHVRVWIAGRRPRTARACPLPAEESAAVLSHYAERHPRSWAALQPVFESLLGTPIRRTGTSLPLVRIEID